MMKSRHDSPILVTGAAGAIGAIGRNLTAMLLARGHKVRALVRREDERADERWRPSLRYSYPLPSQTQRVKRESCGRPIGWSRLPSTPKKTNNDVC